MQFIRQATVVIAALATTVIATCPASGQTEKKLAAWILQDVPQRSALCIHLGIRDGTLTTALSAGGRNLVNGFTADTAVLKRARTHIRSKNLYGMVSVEKAAVSKLPHSDNLVNLVVIDQLRDMLKQGLTLTEVLRVLAPQGVAWIGESATGGQAPLSVKEMKEILEEAKLADVRIVERNGIWARLEKPRPKNIDTWTHFRHGPNGNPVSRDQVIQVPSGVQWMAGPQWPTGHRKQAVPTVVVSEKRLIYIFQDEVNNSGKATKQDSLIVRDAFNGLPLWKRKAPSTYLVADGDIFFTADQRGTLAALDADSGKPVTSFQPARAIKVQGLMVHQKFLFVGSADGLSCLNKKTGAIEWEQKISLKNKNQFIIADDSIFAHVDQSRRGKGSFFVCFDLETGREKWSQPTSSWAKSSPDLILYESGVLVSANKEGNDGISAKTGEHLWSYTYQLIGHGGSYAKIMAMHDLVWIHTANTQETKQYAWEGLDPQTGKVEKRIVQPKEFSIKHRCSYDVATERFFMGGSMDFADLETGQYSHFNAGRNSCATASMLPANGLLYTFPQACGCYSMLRGFIGFNSINHLATKSSDSQLEKGPAYGKPIPFPAQVTDWPTYRHDTTRSGSTTAQGPGQLKVLWTQTISNEPISAVTPEQEEAGSLTDEWSHNSGGLLTSPVIAGPSVFLGVVDQQQIIACDRQTGKVQWQFTARGRIDCPPTIEKQYCLFGSRDGWVYCLRSADGQLAWKNRVAPLDKRILAYGQLESIWPVHGGILVHNGNVFCLTGRHAAADGGLLLHRLDLLTGKKLWSVQPEDFENLPDVLNGEGDTVQMAGLEFDILTGKQQKAKVKRLRSGSLGLLDDTWYQRPIATRKNLQLWSVDDRPSGQLLSFNEQATFGFRYAKVSGGNGTLSEDAELFSSAVKGSELSDWSHKLSTESRVKGIVSTPQRLYVAGRFTADRSGPNVLRCYSVTTGKLIHELEIPHELIHDCLAIAGQHLYLTTESGLLICIGSN